MVVLTLETKDIKEELLDFCIGYDPNKIYLTNDICYAMAHLVTKIEGIEYYCKKVNSFDGLYVTLIKSSDFEYIPQVFVSENCAKKYFKVHAKIFVKSDEDGLFDVSEFSKYPYLNCFFDLLNQCRKESGSFLVNQDMINDSIDKVLGIDESKSKVNKKQYK